jgi:O-antigen/teichoic acid export membrane protein
MAGWIVIAVATYCFAAKHTGFVLPEFDFSKWLKLLKQALPIGLALLFNIVFVKLNMQMLQILSLPSDVLNNYGSVDAQTGYYGLALRFFDNIITVPFFFSNAIFPILIQRKEESINALRKFMEKAVNVMLLIGIPISIGGLILSPQLIYFVSGGFLPGAEETEFIPAIPALQILISGIGIFFTTGVMTWTAVIMDKQWLLPKIYGRILIITLILDIILIPRFGYIGAVIITVLGEFLTFLSHYYYSNKLIGFNFDFIYFSKTLIASLFMGIVVYFVNLKFEDPVYFFIPMISGAVIYFIVGYLLGIFNSNMINTVLQRKK